MAEYQTKTTIVARMTLVMVTGVWFFGVGVQAMVQRADGLRGHILGHRDWMVVGVMPLQRVSRRRLWRREGRMLVKGHRHTARAQGLLELHALRQSGLLRVGQQRQHKHPQLRQPTRKGQPEHTRAGGRPHRQIGAPVG